MDLIAAKERTEEMEEEIENAGLVRFLRDRLQRDGGKRLSANDFLAEIGMSEFVEQLPGG